MKIVCPFCFKEIKAERINYYCNSLINPKAEKLEDKSKPCENYLKKIPVKGKINKNNLRECEICGRLTNTKKCPECNHELPDNILESETKIISIIGGKGCGKSYFVATLLRQIFNGKILNKYGISQLWECNGREEYRRRFETNLEKKIPLPPTNKYTDIVKDNPPLLVELTKEERVGKVFAKNVVNRYTYSFFDAAGEGFEDESTLASVTPYLQNSEALIFILDPNQVESIKEKIKLNFPGVAIPTDKDWSHIINTTIKVLRTTKNISSKAKINIPVCICVSKWDFITGIDGLVPDDLLVSNPEGLTGAYDENMVATISEEIRSLLMEWDGNLVNTVEQSFSDVTYFSFSAWGTSNTNGGGAPAIASYRVEDPYMWILHKCKLI